MPVIDLDTGSFSGEEVGTPQPESLQPETVEAGSGGVIDLETGQFIAEQPTVVPAIAGIDEQAQALAKSVGPLEALGISAGRGMTTILRGLGFAEPEDPVVTRAIEALREEHPIATTAGEVAGEAAPFLLPGGLVAKAVTIPGRVAASTALGATEAATILRGKGATDEQITEGAGLGGAIAGTLELALPVIGRIGGKLIRKITGKTASSPVLDAAGDPSPELASALKKSGLELDDISAEARRQIETGDIVDGESLVRKEFLERQGLVPTRAQVTGGATEFQKQQELAKTSGRVRRALETQEEVLTGKFENAVTLTGGSANRSNSTVVDFVADRSIDLDAAIGDAYEAAKNAAPTEKIVKFNKLTEGMKEIAGSDRATGGLVSAARDILRTRGVLQKGGLKPTGKVSAQVSEEIRQDMNALFNSLTPFGRKKLSKFKDLLDNDVADAVGEDIFSTARQAKAKFEKDLSRSKVNKFDNRKKNLVRDILENKVNPDRFLDDAILSKSVRSADVEQLKRFMNIDGDGPGLDAWNDIRAEAMQRIRDTAFKEVAGEPVLSRAGMESALGRFGRDKLRVMFSKEERNFLNDMLKTSKLREPVRGTALGRGPSAQAIGRLENTIIKNSLLADIFRAIKIGRDGRIAVQQPKISPLMPSRLTQATPALIPAVLEAEETEE